MVCESEHNNYHSDYDTGTGRYIDSDPIGLDGNLNMYAYVANKPVNAIDHFGLSTYGIVIGGAFQETASGA